MPWDQGMCVVYLNNKKEGPWLEPFPVIKKNVVTNKQFLHLV